MIVAKFFVLFTLALCVLAFFKIVYNELMSPLFRRRPKTKRICMECLKKIAEPVVALLVYSFMDCDWCKKELTNKKKKVSLTDKEFN